MMGNAETETNISQKEISHYKQAENKHFEMAKGIDIQKEQRQQHLALISDNYNKSHN
jgi:hypothetical protein